MPNLVYVLFMSNLCVHSFEGEFLYVIICDHHNQKGTLHVWEILHLTLIPILTVHICVSNSSVVYKGLLHLLLPEKNWAYFNQSFLPQYGKDNCKNHANLSFQILPEFFFGKGFMQWAPGVYVCGVCVTV